MIIFTCEHCGIELRVPESKAGKNCICKSCKCETGIPDLSELASSRAEFEKEIEKEMAALGRAAAKGMRAFDAGYEEALKPRGCGCGNLFGILLWTVVGILIWSFWGDISRLFMGR